jgi:hypothetical protein
MAGNVTQFQVSHSQPISALACLCLAKTQHLGCLIFDTSACVMTVVAAPLLPSAYNQHEPFVPFPVLLRAVGERIESVHLVLYIPPDNGLHSLQLVGMVVDVDGHRKQTTKVGVVPYLHAHTNPFITSTTLCKKELYHTLPAPD